MRAFVTGLLNYPLAWPAYVLDPQMIYASHETVYSSSTGKAASGNSLVMRLCHR